MSFFPTAQEQDLLQFHFAKDLSYSSRIVWVAALALVGVAAEVLLPFPIALAGVVLFFVAGLLLSAKGYTNKPAPVGAGFWKTADVDRLDRILELQAESRSWDLTAFDISNILGLLVFVLIVFATVAIAAVAAAVTKQTVFVLFAASAAALFLPTWMSGLRAGYSNAELLLKARLIKSLLTYFDGVKQPGETAKVSLKLRGPETDAVPEDIKLQISWPDASPDYYGLQGQVNINVVQGNKYPYCYFVVVAKRGMAIFPAAQALLRDVQTTVETKTQNDVEVIIVRQHTTRTSGYHTKYKRCVDLMNSALFIGRRVAQMFPKS